MMSAEVEEVIPPSELATDKPDADTVEGEDAVEADLPSALPKGSSSSNPPEQGPKGPRSSSGNPPEQGPKGPRSSFSNPPDQGPKGPRASFSNKAADPADRPSPPKVVQFASATNSNRPQPGGSNRPTMQRQFGQALNRASSILPNGQGLETWMYAAIYVALYTLLLLFRMSTFSFILNVVYTILVAMLALRFYGQGPLANAFGQTRSPFRR